MVTKNTKARKASIKRMVAEVMDKVASGEVVMNVATEIAATPEDHQLTAVTAAEADIVSQLELEGPEPEAPTPTEIAEALATIEDAVTEVVQEPEAAVEPEGNVPSFAEVRVSITEEEASAMQANLLTAVDERADFEAVKDAGNANIQRYLKNVRASFSVNRGAAVVMCACNASPNVLNRSIHEGARYNVYAMGKLTDAIRGLNGGVPSNAINLAVMRSLFRFRAAKLAFTMEHAKAAASDKVRSEEITKVKAHLVRHTVSASTASTQASSTMQALETLGLVVRTGSSKNPVFHLSDTPQVAELEAALKRAA